MKVYRDGPSEIIVRPVSAPEVWSLRHQVLRPTQTIEEMEWEGDFDSGTAHFGAFVGDSLVGILTMLSVDREKRSSRSELQLRGMAALPEVQGIGVGSALLNYAIHCARELGAECLWCNARLSAASFYIERGFTCFGQEFEIPHAGPHIRMELRIQPDRS